MSPWIILGWALVGFVATSIPFVIAFGVLMLRQQRRMRARMAEFDRDFEQTRADIRRGGRQ